MAGSRTRPLVALFGDRNLVVADGVDQLVRQSKRCEWSELSPKRRQIVSLRKSMRMKSNLCRFVITLGEELGIPWEMDVNTDIRGGRIIVLENDYSQEFHDRIYGEHATLGNMPIDFMFCVTGAEGSDSAWIREQLLSAGHKVWHGTASRTRSSFPTDVRQYRIVRYESARGLEGWTVVCLNFDSFFEKQVRAGEHLNRGPYEDQSELAHAFASQWALIPVTRAIDTLVLQVSGNGVLSNATRAASASHPDFVRVLAA